MRRTTVICALIAIGLISNLVALSGQDFIMQGCYWSCPNDRTTEIDSSALTFWISKMKEQAPELSHAGFTYLGLPSLMSAPKKEMVGLMSYLNKAGLTTMADLFIVPSKDSLTQQDTLSHFASITELSAEFNLKGLRFHFEEGADPSTIARLLRNLEMEARRPDLCINSISEHNDPSQIADWINQLQSQIGAAEDPEQQPRIYDVILREALRTACMDSTYDVRNIFNQSLRDATALSGFNLVTLVNSPRWVNQNNIAGDWDDRIYDPLLAYVYTLTNNQVGMPEVFYADYYGSESEVDDYLQREGLKDDLDQLLKAHQQYIFNSTSIEYLNRLDSDKKSVFLTGDHAQKRALIYQLDGTNTVAGKANNDNGGRDVLVAINFGADTLRVVQEINAANLQAGDFFTDILGNSFQEETIVGYDTLHEVANAVYFELPPKSYSVWVQGQAPQVIPSLITLDLSAYEDFVELSWDIPFEQGIRGYSIERSVNGNSFEAIAWMDALGEDQSGATYLFVDDDIFPDENLHYRVKMIDWEGKYEYSPVGVTKIQLKELSLELVDGELDSNLAVKVTSNYSDQVELSIFDAHGNQVLSKHQKIQKGQTHAQVDLKQLPKGVYFLNLTTKNHKTLTRRILNL